MQLPIDLSANVSARALTERVGDALAAARASAQAGTNGTVDGENESDGGAIVFSLAGGEDEGGVAAHMELRMDGAAAASGALRFHAGAVTAEAAERFLAHLVVVRAAMAAAPERGILELPLLTDQEEAERVRWNATETELPHGVCLHQAFERWVDDAPGAAAIVHGDEEISYGELEARANRLAHHLRRRGVGPESRVGICVERGPRFVSAILGVLKAGGAYVPLDATYPPERLAGMVRTAGIRVLVTEEGIGDALSEGLESVFLDRDSGEIEAESGDRPEGGAEPENLAYVIFTSGSTGEPKGIALRHRGVMNNLADLNQGHAVGPADRVLLLSSLSFDMSVYETLGILSAGGAVVIPQPHQLRDPAAWAALCRDHHVTLWNSAPALLGLLNEHAESHPEDAPAGLRLAFLGGDWVPVPLVDRVRAWAPGLRDFIVMGGATEASIHSIIFPVHEVDPAWRSIPYGVPMANQRAWILDRHLRPVPAGVAGELFLGGIGLARGYTGRPGFTAERFLPNPHGAPGERIYRTGDRARYGDGGVIELLGRIDHQVKIRGMRIEPGEIEAALRRHPAVARAVVAARADGGDARLVAYLVCAEGQAEPDPRELREMLRGSLPDYMVPAVYVVLDRLPLSPNGKVDRKQLPAPPAGVERAPYVAPTTPAEAALAEIWAEVLGTDRVGADDDFFALGGQSLLATRVAMRVRERLGVQLALGEFFRVPTLRELAATVEAQGGGGPAAAPIPRVPGDGPFPLSFAQESLWFLDRLQPESAFYNIPSAVRLTGGLDVTALDRARGECVNRHPALRTVFEERDGVPVQRITPYAGFSLPVEDLSRGASDARDQTVLRRAAEEAARPFDLATGPLFRANLLRIDDDEHVLLLCMHHVASDGWSLEVLFRELPVLYQAFRGGQAPALPAPPVRYADYAVWQREQLRGPAFDARLAWWRERLAGAPELLELPTDRPRPAVQSYRGARERFAVSAELAGRLSAAGRAEGATLYMVLLAAFQVLLAKYAASDDVVVGSPIAGRTRPELEGVVGFFANTLALRADLSGNPSFSEVLRRVREGTLGAFEQQEVPFEKLVEELSPARTLDRNPLVQVAFALQGVDRSAVSLPGLLSRGVELETGTTKFDLFLELT
ncbi:MAG TPA: amino acid adenylation domain-containing protein, partial [Longimicrobium sp.]|nr:amino acid adenylation domain-containing protein [Longimicrobium sp.]